MTSTMNDPKMRIKRIAFWRILTNRPFDESDFQSYPAGELGEHVRRLEAEYELETPNFYVQIEDERDTLCWVLELGGSVVEAGIEDKVGWFSWIRDPAGFIVGLWKAQCSKDAQGSCFRLPVR